MPRKLGFVSVLMVVLVVTLVSGFDAHSVKADGWVHYVPGEDQVSFDYSKFNGTSYVNISIYFGSSDYNVSDWGTPAIVGTNVSVDAEIWMWTGISFPLDMRVSHQYNLGNLTSGQYVFSFRVWTYPVKDNTFIVLIIVPDDYPTIQEAIDNANEGDTVFVRNGTYSGPIVVDKSLTLEGENRDATMIDGGSNEPSGSIVLVTADNVKITGFTIQHCRGGGNAIYLDNYVNLTFSYNIITGCNEGVRILHSSGNVVSYNIVQDCYYNTGLGFDWAFNNTVDHNMIVHNHYGISGGYDCHNNTYSENTLLNNDAGFGTNVYDSKFFHNNFINNSVHVVANGVNQFDDGYPSGGNYWSDYNGSDLFLGPAQDQVDSDGIGDTPYIIDENNVDHYPLMNTWTSPDAAALNITSSKTIVGQGFYSNVTVILENQGGKIEELNATFYANETFTEYQTFLLRSGDSIIYTHNWNSAGLAKGNYTLSIHIEPIEGETDVTDNSLCDGWILVTIPGDLSGDFTVNILDAILLAGCFSSHPASHHWNPNTDINSDNIVDIYDALILAGHYNQHYP